MTDEELAEIEGRLRAASKLWFTPDYVKPTLITNAPEDLILITHAPADILALLAEVRRLRTEVATSNELLTLGERLQTAENVNTAEMLTMLQNSAVVHTNILRGTIALTREQALHIAGATDYDTLLEEVRQRREADVDPMIAVKAYEAAHGGRSFTFRRGSNIFSHSGATAQEAWANAGMPPDEFGTWWWYEITEVKP